jgi:hypothetical protein
VVIAISTKSKSISNFKNFLFKIITFTNVKITNTNRLNKILLPKYIVKVLDLIIDRIYFSLH